MRFDKSKKRRSLRIEMMEERRLLAADIVRAVYAPLQDLAPAEAQYFEPVIGGGTAIQPCGAPTSSLQPNGTLELNGTPCNDNLEVRLHPDDPSKLEIINHNTGDSISRPATTIHGFTAKLYGGNDRLTINDQYGQVLRGRLIILIGGTGDDYFEAGASRVFAFGEQGNDSLHGGDGDDLLSGGEGRDLLFGYLGNDELFGDEGNDQLYGHEGNDT